MMEKQNVPVTICMNKKDLGTEEDIQEFQDAYGGAGYDILQQGFEEAMRINMAKRTTMVYDKNSIHALLRKSAGLAPVGEQKAMERFVGRYGVMPDGRPVSPSHDPRIAESFSYNPATGEFSVTAPNFIRDRIEKAKESFKRSLQVDG